MTRARILADYVAGGTTAAEFDYMDGVTSNVQTQMDAKAPLASPTFTGNFTSVGIDDNADANAITIDSSENVTLSKNLVLSVTEPVIDMALGNGTIKAEDSLVIMMDSNDQNTGGETISFKTDSISTAMTIKENGWVGLNTTAPEAPLEVELSNAGFVAKFDNAASGTQYKGILIMCGFDGANFTNTALEIYDGDGDSQGTITFTGGTVSYNAFTAGHDVKLPDEDNENGYPYGTLVENTGIFYKKREKGDGTDFERGILYNAQKTSTAYSKSVLGAYSGKFSDQPNMHQVYVLGDGHILCNGEKGNISIGDGICTSSADGEGMKADKMAMIIGIAQEDVTFSGNESKLVAVQYGLRQFTPWTE